MCFIYYKGIPKYILILNKTMATQHYTDQTLMSNITEVTKFHTMRTCLQ